MTPFLRHLEMMKEIHDRKSRDYSSSDDRFVNYHRQATIISWFEHPQDQTYAGRIAEKLSRLATLRNQEHHADREDRDRPVATNEPLTDTFLDCCTIFNIWWSDYEGGYRPVAHQPSTPEGSDRAGSQAARQGLPHDEGGALLDTERAASHRDRGPASEGEGPADCPVHFPRKSLVNFVEVIRMGYLNKEELRWLIEVAHKAYARA